MEPGPDERRVRPRLLILDQFEELFTTHPDRYTERSDFFRQIQESLSTYAHLSLLLSMREDFIARLDSYVVQMPDRLRTRFRMERLSAEGALLAVTGPAEAAGRHFAPDVAEALVDNLRRIQVGDVEGADADRPTAALGTYVEPVHLQIVCRRLWSNLPAERILIAAADVQEFGDVDAALIGFYEETLASVVTETGIGERRLRRWFEEKLITPARTRGLVYRGRRETANMANRAVDILRDAYIIRADIRGTDTWYELAHDRLVEPVFQSNHSWFAKHQSPVARDAAAWISAGKPGELLYSGDQFENANKELAEKPDDFSELEREFIEQAQDRERRHKMRRQGRVVAGTVILAIVLLALAIFNAVNWYSARTAAAEAEAAESRAVAAQATAEAEAERANEAEELARLEEQRAREAERRARAK